MENYKFKQQLREDNLRAAKAVFYKLKTAGELRQIDIHNIVCESRGWDPYYVTLSWNFRTIKRYLRDHGLATRYTRGNGVYFKATPKALSSTTFNEAVGLHETQDERVEAFKERYSEQLEKFETRNREKVLRVVCTNGMVAEPKGEFRGLQLNDEVIYYRKKTGESGEGYVSSVTTYSTRVVNQNCFSLSVFNGFIKGIGYVESEDMFLESNGDEIQIIKKTL
jgi:hypothetical protein